MALPPGLVVRILMARAVRPVRRAGTARAAIGITGPLAVGTLTIPAAFRAAPVIAGHGAIAAVAIRIPEAVLAVPALEAAVTLAPVAVAATEFVTPGGIVIAFAGRIAAPLAALPAAVVKAAVIVAAAHPGAAMAVAVAGLLMVAVPVAPVAAVIVAVAAAPAALALFPHAVFAPTAFGILIPEPGGDLVAGALEEAALVAVAPVVFPIAVVGPSRAFITRRVPRVVPVICHVSSSVRLRRAGVHAGGNSGKNDRAVAAVPLESTLRRRKSAGRKAVGTGDCKGGNKRLGEPLA